MYDITSEHIVDYVWSAGGVVCLKCHSAVEPDSSTPSSAPQCGRASHLIVEQHVEPLPVSFDLGGDVLVLQDHALPSTLAPLCNEQTHRLDTQTGSVTCKDDSAFP